MCVRFAKNDRRQHHGFTIIMRRSPFVLTFAAVFSAASPAIRGADSDSSGPLRVTSPDERLTAIVTVDSEGAPRYRIDLDGRTVLQESRLGLIRDDADFSRNLELVSTSEAERIADRYEILTAKRRINTYVANRRVVHLATADGKQMDIIFQVSNDGVAFRYFFPETSNEVRRIAEEVSSFHFLPGTRAWLQPMSVAKSGWSRTNPSYEEDYEKDIPVGTPSPLAGWVYPALFRSNLDPVEASPAVGDQASAAAADDTWLLVSEGSLPRNYCGTRLRAESPNGEYTVGFPDPREHFQDGPVNPESSLPWLTPWRFVVVGSLKTIAESTLGLDLAEKSARPMPTPPPGKASWSWPLLKDEQTIYDAQRRFIEYAAEMGWRYCLIDALWDQQIGYDKVKELIDYGQSKNVAILLWYNSAGDWNDAPQTPRDKMLTRESRVREFERLREMGVAGLKIDFFGGDGQSVIGYYHDILEDASQYGLSINFHGCTLPRGWNRTYPHLMTMEAIKGLEFVTFDQQNANEQPAHCTVLPFTRNVFDPMDYTPVVLDQIPRIERRTSSAFELALSVLFTSGIQHYAEIPEGMAKAPDYVRDFLMIVPEIWDDTKFLDGYPGEYVVLARQGDGRWFVAGINGQDQERALSLDLGELTGGGGFTGTLIGDGDPGRNLSFRRESVRLAADEPLELTLPPHGGFVLVAE